MSKNNYKIYQLTSVIVLAIIISGLLNICLFAFRVKTATAAPIHKAAARASFSNGENCGGGYRSESGRIISRSAAGLPQCCLEKNRNFQAIVGTANNLTAPVFYGPPAYSTDILNPEKNITDYSLRIAYPPPAALALASTIIRE